jgi:RNA polymerase sigma-70 factor, ECF subfamily
MTYATLMTAVPPPETVNAPRSASGVLAQIRSGDSAAFEQLFHDTYPALVAFAERYAGDRARAEELVQDLFLDLWKTRAAWDVRGTLRGYLFGALRNRALNLRRRDAIEDGWSTDSAHDAILSLHSTPAPVGDELIADEQRAAVQQAFDLLPERCRLAMHLRWREGMSYSEIADVLGITVKSVENHLARGLKALRARVHGE